MFSLRMLMAVVAISAVYIAGMVYRTQFWAAAIVALTYMAYAAAGTAAILSQKRRAFFSAFVMFGLAYSICVFFVPRDRMPTEIALQKISSKVPHKIRPPTKADTYHKMFISIGHSLFAVMISLAAGVVTQAVVNRPKKADESVNPPLPPRPQ